MLGTQAPQQQAPTRETTQDRQGPTEAEDRDLAGNRAALDAAGLDGAPPEDGGLPLPPALAERIDAQIAAASAAVQGVEGTGALLPPAWQAEAAWLLGYVPDLVAMLQEDRAALAHARPGEEGLLVDLELNCAELTDRLLALDALRDLGEKTHRLRMLELGSALSARIVPVAVLAPRLLDQLALAREAARAREEVRAAALDAGEATVQLLADLGLQTLVSTTEVANPVGALVVDQLGNAASDRLDDALGADPAVLPGAVLGWAERGAGALKAANTIETAVRGAEAVGDSALIAALEPAVAVLDAGGEALDAELRVVAALNRLRLLGPRLLEARAAFAETRGLLGPLVASFQSGLADTLTAAGQDVADAAWLVAATMSEG